jgi:hypothetical protein
MEYGAHFINGTQPANNSVDGKYTTSQGSFNNEDAGITTPTLEVILDYASDNNRIGSIKVVTPGAGYAIGDTLAFTIITGATTREIVISNLNPVQVAILNGVYSNIPVPVEIGDTFIVKFSTQMAPTQKNAALETIGGETSQTHDTKIIILVG